MRHRSWSWIRGLALAPLVIAACAELDLESSPPEPPLDGADPAAAPVDEPGAQVAGVACAARPSAAAPAVTIVSARFRASSTVTSSEHCLVAPARLAALAGRQVRVASGTRTGLCTVAGAHALDVDGDGAIDADVVAMSSAGLTDKFGSSAARTGALRTAAGSDGWVTACVETPAPGPGDRPAGGLGEHYAVRAGATAIRAAFTAPHGGIEQLTEGQVAEIVGWLGGDYAAWTVIGDGAGGHGRWHVTATELSEASFHGLAQLAGAAPRMVVAFHGHATCTPDVVVGGGVSLDVRAGVARAIEQRLAQDGVTDVSVSTSTTCHGGTAAANFVNRLSQHGDGLQLEQSLTMRSADAAGAPVRTRAVARAVGTYVMAYADAPDLALGAAATRTASRAGGRWTAPAGRRVRSDVDYGRCPAAGGAARADWFVRIAGALRSVGGGDLVCTQVAGQGLRYRGRTGFRPVDRTPAATEVVIGVVVTPATGGQPRVRLY